MPSFWRPKGPEERKPERAKGQKQIRSGNAPVDRSLKLDMLQNGSTPSKIREQDLALKKGVQNDTLGFAEELVPPCVFLLANPTAVHVLKGDSSDKQHEASKDCPNYNLTHFCGVKQTPDMSLITSTKAVIPED